MAIVGGHQRDARLLRKRLEAGENPALLLQAVVHDLHEVVALAEKRLHLERVLFRVLHAPLQQQLGQIAAETRREADEPLGVLPEDVVVDAGFIIEAFRESGADELDEVVIAGLVFAQQNQVTVLARRAVLLKAVGADVDLAADDGHDALVHAGVVEVDRAVHHPVVGHGGVRKTKLLEPLDQGLDAVGSVQEAVFGMQVEMGKGHGRLLWAGPWR